MSPVEHVRSRPYPSLKAWREAQRPQLSQREAAQKFGISQTFWCRIERGIQHPQPGLAKRLMDETGVSLETIFGIAS